MTTAEEEMGLNCLPVDFLRYGKSLQPSSYYFHLMILWMTHLLKTFEDNVRSCPLATSIINRSGLDAEKYPILLLLQQRL